MKANDVSSLIVAAGERRWLARGGFREHDAFLGHEMKGPAGIERGGVSMAGWRAGQGARKRNGVIHWLSLLRTPGKWRGLQTAQRIRRQGIISRARATL